MTFYEPEQANYTMVLNAPVSTSGYPYVTISFTGFAASKFGEGVFFSVKAN